MLVFLLCWWSGGSNIGWNELRNGRGFCCVKCSCNFSRRLLLIWRVIWRVLARVEQGLLLIIGSAWLLSFGGISTTVLEEGRTLAFFAWGTLIERVIEVISSRRQCRPGSCTKWSIQFKRRSKHITVTRGIAANTHFIIRRATTWVGNKRWWLHIHALLVCLTLVLEELSILLIVKEWRVVHCHASISISCICCIMETSSSTSGCCCVISICIRSFIGLIIN